MQELLYFATFHTLAKAAVVGIAMAVGGLIGWYLTRPRSRIHTTSTEEAPFTRDIPDIHIHTEQTPIETSVDTGFPGEYVTTEHKRSRTAGRVIQRKVKKIIVR